MKSGLFLLIIVILSVVLLHNLPSVAEPPARVLCVFGHLRASPLLRTESHSHIAFQVSASPPTIPRHCEPYLTSWLVVAGTSSTKYRELNAIAVQRGVVWILVDVGRMWYVAHNADYEGLQSIRAPRPPRTRTRSCGPE